MLINNAFKPSINYSISFFQASYTSLRLGLYGPIKHAMGIKVSNLFMSRRHVMGRNSYSLCRIYNISLTKANLSLPPNLFLYPSRILSTSCSQNDSHFILKFSAGSLAGALGSIVSSFLRTRTFQPNQYMSSMPPQNHLLLHFHFERLYFQICIYE